jgi:tetratricopeptide (TPR) repeat protein
VQARLLDVVGQMSFQLARYDEAQQWLEDAVGIRRKTLGPGSLDLATSLIHLARVHRARNDYDRARPLVAEALDIRQRALPPYDPAIADAIYELGWLAAGPEQERLYAQALAILRDTISTATAERTVTILKALSTNLRRQGRFAEAVTTDRDALREAERAFGPEHHETGSAMIHLADHVRDIEQDLAGAERLLRRGLELIAKRYGENSVRLTHGLNSLASLVAARGDSGTEAEQLYRRALAIRQAATGPEHPGVGEQLHYLARELARQRRLDEAEALARQALDVSRRTLGPRHLVISTQRLPLLAYVVDEQGRHAAADETYRSAFALAAQSAGVFVGEMRRDYGRMLTRRGDYVRAEQELLESAVRLERFFQRSDHPNVYETKRALVELYRRWGKPEMAERYRVPPGRYIPY